MRSMALAMALIDRRLYARLKEVVYGHAPWPILMLGGVGVGKTCAAL